MILYLSYDGLTDPLGQSQILPYLFGLSANGYEIQIISFEKKERFETSKSVIEELISRHENITWHPLTYHRSPPLFSTAYDLWKLKKKAGEIILKNNIKIVHCRSYPTSAVGNHLKKKYGTKFIFDMRGFYIDERFDGQIWNIKNPVWRWLYPKLKKLELNMINNADTVVSLTHEGKREMLSWPNVVQKKIEVTPCAVDLKHFNQPYVEDQTNLNIVYLGSLGTWYLLDEMLDFFKRLVSRIPNSIFHFITTDSSDSITNRALEKNISLENIRIYSSARADLPSKLSAMDLSIFFIKPSFSKKASSPTKLGELLSMGIPVICNKNVGDLNQQSHENDHCIFAIDMDNKAYDRLIDKISSLKTMRSKGFEATRATAKKYFSLEAGVEKYTHIYLQLTNED